MILDDDSVEVELLTAMVTVPQPQEISDYARAFTELTDMAVYGAPARKLITDAIAALG